jgi:rsbT co-antagonist protein RsbR
VSEQTVDGDLQPLSVQIAELRAELTRTKHRLEMFEKLAENASDTIFIYDQQGTIIYHNPAALRMHHLQPSDSLLGTAVTARIAPEELSRLSKEIPEAFAKNGFWSGLTKLQRPDGSNLISYQSTTMLPRGEDGVVYQASFGRDVTEQVQAEERMRVNEERLHIVINNAPIVLFALDRDGVFTLSDGHGLKAMGLEPGQVVGMSAFDLYRDAPDFVADLRRALAGETVKSISAGSGLSYEQTFVPLRDAQGEISGMLGVAIDTTDRTRAEEQRIALQEEVIQAQQAALRELSTPLIPIAEGVIAMPLIGTIDSARAQQMMEALLTGVAEQQSEVAIVDITGVQVVDTQVAAALLRTAQAVQMLGAKVVLTGIRPEVAQTLVGIGADLSSIITKGTFQMGIAYALERH